MKTKKRKAAPKAKRVDEVVWVAAYKDGWPFIQSVSFYKRVPQLFIRQSKLDARTAPTTAFYARPISRYSARNQHIRPIVQWPPSKGNK